MNNKRTHILPANPNKISRMDYSKHPHAKIISVVVGVVALVVLHVWAFTVI